MCEALGAEDCRNHFYLFTSIPPRLSGDKLAYQRDCIASWRSAGFKVASVNGSSEQQDVDALDLGVEILPGTGAGKPAVIDLLAAIRTKGCRYAGIINSDCAIIRFADLACKLRTALDRTLLCAERVDVDTNSVLQPEACSGLDAFFFDTSIMPANFSPTFRIGEPWWDYWLPLTVARQGARVASLDIPLLTHKLHEPSWHREDWERIGRHFWSLLRASRAPNSLDTELEESWANTTLTTAQLDALAVTCFQWLKTREPVEGMTLLPSDMADVEWLLRSLKTALKMASAATNLRMQDRTRMMGEIVKLKMERDELKWANATLGAKVTAMEQSRSWKLTKPLRRLRGFKS